MSGWDQALDAAGIDDAGLRRDYTAQREVVTRYRRSSALAARMLLPRPLVPRVMAMTAFMHHGDNLLDSGPREERAGRYADWDKRVRDALATGDSDDPLIRTVLHTTSADPRVRGVVEEYLGTATAELDFSGFATEADYQRYVDAYALPAFMLVAGLLAPQDDPVGYRAACRTYIDAAQRLDFVNDLAEDLADGRFTVPAELLDHFGVTRADLESARELPGTAELLRHLLGLARRTLDEGRALVDRTAPAGRPLVRCLIALDYLTADAALAKGTGLLRGPASPSALAALRALLREYRQARRMR